MPGAPKRREEINRLNETIADQAAEIRTLRRALARTSPETLEQIDKKQGIEKGQPFGTVTARNQSDLCKLIESMAGEGMLESETIAALGFTARQWKEIRADFPQVREAIARARVRARAWLEGSVRRSLDERDTRFPIHTVNAMLNRLDQANDQDGEGSGDASQRVIIDLRGAEGDKFMAQMTRKDPAASAGIGDDD